MAFNGSGLFNRLYNWVNDAAAGINIRADRSDAELDGIATGLSTCITKDGQTTTTASIPFAAGITTTDLTTTGNTILGDASTDTVVMNGKSITSPNRCAFLAYNSATDTNVTGNGATTTVQFDTEVFDQGNDFAANTFTAPVTGLYQFNISVESTDLTAVMTGHTLNFVVVGTSARIYRYSIGFTPVAGGGWQYPLSVLAKMTATDTATVTLTITGGAGDTADIVGGAVGVTYFSGFLVG